MKYVIRLSILTVVVITMAAHVVWAEEYRLGSGDILSFGVWGYEDLQVKELAIRPDGKVSFPIIGEVNVMGKCVGQLTDQLTEGLSHYIYNPKVTVNIIKPRTTRVYVLGEVIKPGLYEIEKQHNLLDAIGIAGGYTKNAAKKQVMILRKEQRSNPIKVNLLNILKNGDMSQNYVLNEGDVVYLTDNGKINFATDILPWISATYQVVRMDKD